MSGRSGASKGKTGASPKFVSVHFILEQCLKELTAKAIYTFIKAALGNSGIKILHQVGDEAYYHADEEIFFSF